jgi:hypothetical protein
MLLALSKPFWHRQIRNPVGVLSLLAVPVVIAGIWGWAGGPADRWVGLMLLGWTMGGIVPAALNARRDESVELRWRSMPVGAAERWLGAYLALLPLPLVTSLLLALVGMSLGPTTQHTPFLLALAATVALVMVALGMAIGAWSRSAWQVAGGLGIALVVCAWVLLPGVAGWPLEVVPTGQAKLALIALALGQSLLVPALKLGMMGIVLAIAGIAGVGRR